MATKTPAKGKKPAAKDGAKKARAKAVKPAPAEPEVDEAEDGDEDEDDDEEVAAAPAKPAPKKPAQKGDAADAPPVVPARRLTPEAKAKVNEMVAKGMPLGEALKAAAAWETFVAPVKDEPAKLVQGKSFEGGPRPQRPRKSEDDDAGPSFDDEEPAAEAEE